MTSILNKQHIYYIMYIALLLSASFPAPNWKSVTVNSICSRALLQLFITYDTAASAKPLFFLTAYVAHCAFKESSPWTRRFSKAGTDKIFSSKTWMEMQHRRNPLQVSRRLRGENSRKTPDSKLRRNLYYALRSIYLHHAPFHFLLQFRWCKWVPSLFTTQTHGLIYYQGHRQEDMSERYLNFDLWFSPAGLVKDDSCAW